MLVRKLSLFLSYCRSECSFSHHTCSAYESDLKQFFSVSKFDESDSLSLYYNWVSNQGFAPKTIHRKLACLRSFFQFCIREGYCEAGILLEIPRYSVPVRLPYVLDAHVIDRLLTFPDVSTKKGLRDRVLLELLYSTGIRVSECVFLKPSHIDFVDGVISVLGKGHKQRLIPLTTRSQHFLSLYLSEFNDQTWLFQVSSKKSFSRFTVYSIVKRYVDRMSQDVSISPHSFRHAFATHLLEGGARLRDVQLLLGHRHLSSSQVYSHVATSTIKNKFLQAHPRGMA